ncbi:hypothetical protein [Halolamina sp. C58]|uniref:hypothetical protein n=1 Tax=Halolamina sp. C58 TaxID=3421640 RepID=UPI003EBBF17D
MTDTKRLAFGQERQVSLRYLLIGTGISLVVFVLKFVGYTFGGPQVLFSGIVAVLLLSLVAAVLGAAHARKNEGLLTSILLAFLPALAALEFDIIFDVGHPNSGILYGVWLALLFAIPVGVVAFVIGRRF